MLRNSLSGNQLRSPDRAGVFSDLVAHVDKIVRFQFFELCAISVDFENSTSINQTNSHDPLLVFQCSRIVARSAVTRFHHNTADHDFIGREFAGRAGKFGVRPCYRHSFNTLKTETLTAEIEKND